MKIELVGINIRPTPDWKKNFGILCFGDIKLPEIETTLRGCALAWSYQKLIALPPKIPGAHPGDLGALQWNPSGKFAKDVRDAILDGYEKMGGEMPPEPSEKQQTSINATRRLAEKAKPEPIERRIVPAVFTVHEGDEANDHEAVEGLHRTLGIDPGVAEAMEEAGL